MSKDESDTGGWPETEVGIVLKSGAVLGPVRIPWAEAEQLLSAIWPPPEQRQRPGQSVSELVTISSPDGVRPPWMLAFNRSEVAGMSSIALLPEDVAPAPEADGALAGG